MSYPSLEDVKAYLGITDSTHDVILTQIMTWTEALFLDYLGRNLLLAEYTQEFYMLQSKTLQLDNYPVTEIVTLTLDDTVTELDDFYLKEASGQLYGQLQDYTIISVVYTGGYQDLPPVIEDCFYGVVEDRYNDYIGESDSDVKDVTLFDFGKVSFDTTTSDGGISYSGVDSSGNIPEPLIDYLGRLDMYKSNTVLMNAAGSR